MAAVNSNVSNINNEGEHIEDVITYLKEASQVLGDIASIAKALKDQMAEFMSPPSNAHNLADAIWRLAMDAENVSGYQLDEIGRNGIRQEANRIQVAKEASHEN